MSRCLCPIEARGSIVRVITKVLNWSKKEFDRFAYSNTYKKCPNLYWAHSQILVILIINQLYAQILVS